MCIRDRVKVTDFGIARAGDPKENLTQTGVVMGTATYFSPEQAQGLPTDQRTDVYSLGVVLYEMVTGRPPFAGETPVAIAYKHVKEPPVPPRVVEPTVPEDFEAIVLAAMEKDREDRYPTADELRADLIRFARGQTPKAVRVREVLAGPVPAAPVDVPVADATMAVAPVSPGPTVVLPRASPEVRRAPPSAPPPVPPPPSADPDAHKPRTGLFIGLSVGLLAILLVLLFLLARLLGFGGGAEQVAVVDVVNKSFDEASVLLRDKGFKVAREERPDASAAPGTVLAQDPEGGADADRGSEVKLTVAKATSTVEVPSVVNLKQDEAEASLRERELVPVIEQVKSTSVGEGFVFEQSPTAKTQVDKGSKVTIRVSTGEGLPPVPDVANLPVAEAVSRLTAAGFKTRQVDENSPSVPAGTVTRTDPPAGGSLPKGATSVSVFVSRGAPSTTVGKVLVPNVIGRDEAGARAALTGVGLRVEVQTSSGGTPGRVKAQSQSAGTRVDLGSTVTITLGAPSTSTSTAGTTSSTSGSTTSTTAP